MTPSGSGRQETSRQSGAPSHSCSHRTESAKDHDRTQSGVYLFLMPGFNAEGRAADCDAFPLSLRDRNDNRRKAQNHYYQSNEE
jgi:hypothetical protein